ncbi:MULTISPECIES: murein biosynthesis integral membrane protein MurJ [unclassified Ruegeria]|uniref:murein biosynthesis integral membrane protein MurJ n=1 Tax=unclassified Ruegeria TaxID=2625375 RepID=UPI0014892A78|nr:MULTISPECIES: murein biosynthesis integral membrane protein MurJ [unclassified Ruegeria]NOD64175.1 murein biosynthesis integral membrane protein MurJ [Ruegeria sp. HKCCD6109]NOD76595.1 murein biosynthesis integral membrane protein MurJ [Ruegeria sp. HKCCD4332]NOD89315.1 murein biosynthesis integral membrane protein MurJ [Ruegeria sp. HKCCD4318]NOE13522.1 murein biosynthesis integral membrane protein MurJ [Ruegeria sp. HKCCD4318-2]NOG07729.1 murein biosynthesis integral membrane protein MurJ
MKQIRLISGFFTVGFWTLASRILGFLREILLTALIGPGPVMDAFVAAFRLPNMFRRFFAEGAFNAAFVPMFSKRLEADENPQGFAQDAFNLLALAVLALVGLALVFMPGLVWLTAEGFYGDERFDLAVDYGYVVFPYILFMSLAALFSGVLNATGRFAAAAAAPVLLNIFACTALIAGALSGGEVIRWLISVIPAAGIAQLALVWVATERAGIRIRPGLPKLTPEMRRMVRIAVPAALAMGVTQVNLVVGQLVASKTEKAVSWLFAADRLYQLPLGVVGIAIGIVLLPDLSRRLRAEDKEGARNAFSRAGEFMLLLTLPSTVAFLVIPNPLVSVLFERGQFTSEDTTATALAVAIYGIGLPAFMLQKLLQPLYFARENTRSPFHYAVVAMIVNAALAFGLFPLVGWIAPAIAASTAGWAMVVLLAIGARNMGGEARFDDRFKQRAGRIVLASIGMGVVLYAALLAFGWTLSVPGWRYLALLVLIMVAAASYFGLGHLLGAFKLSEFKRALRRS